MMNLFTTTKSIVKAFGIRLSQALVALFIVCTLPSQALADWPFRFGGDSDDKIRDVVVHPSGGVIVAGRFEETIVFEDPAGGPVQEMLSAGGDDIYVARYATSGDLLWATQIRGVDTEFYDKTVIDDDGTIVVFGRYRQTVRFGKHSLPNTTGGFIPFVGRLGADGEWLLPNATSGTSGTTTGETEPGGDGIYIAVNDDLKRWSVNDVTGVVSFDSLNSWSIFVSGIQGVVAGNDGKIFVYSRDPISQTNFCGTQTAFGNRHYISLWQQDQNFVNGQFEYTISCQWLVEVDNFIHPFAGTIATDGENAYYLNEERLAKVNAFGNLIVDDFSASSASTIGGSSGLGNGLAVDEFGNVVISGVYKGAPVIGEGSVKEHLLPNATVATPFVARRSASGTWQWAKAPDTSNTPAMFSSAFANVSIDMNSNGQVYMGTHFVGDMEFRNNPSEVDPPTLTSKNTPDDVALNLISSGANQNNHLALQGGILKDKSVFTYGFRARVNPGGISGKPTQYGAVLDVISPGGQHLFSAFLQRSNRMSIYSNASYISNPGFLFVDVPAFEDGQWHQYTVTRSTSPGEPNIFYAVFVDGVLRGSASHSCAPDCSVFGFDSAGLTVGQFNLGATGTFESNFKFEGWLDEIRLWNGFQAVPDEEPTLHGDGYVDLLAYWNFNDPYNDQLLLDKSGNGYDLMVNSDTPTRVLADPDILTRTNYHDNFMGLLDGFNGEWITPQEWVVGDAITPPGGTFDEITGDVYGVPDISIEGLTPDQNQYYFFWSEADKTLYSIGVPPGAVTLDWKTSNDPADLSRVTTDGVNIFPSPVKIQYHIAGAPALLDTAVDPGGSGPMRFGGVVSPSGATSLVQLDGDNKLVFNQQLLNGGATPEEVVLLYYKTGDASVEGNNLVHSPYFVTVQTVAWDNEHVNQPSDKDVAVPIGKAIVDGKGPNPFWTVSAGKFHTCALDDTAVTCWGAQHANMPALSNPVAMSTSVNHTCAIDDTGVKCWGLNNFDQSTPPALSNPVAVSTHFNNSCAIDDTGVKCWGNAGNGVNEPPALSNPVSVTLGNYHACALDRDGVKCWGDNTFGQSTPPALSNPVAVTAGDIHTCALDDAGVKCWGSNSIGRSSVPVLNNPVAVSAGSATTCALDDNGVTCWGDISSGQNTGPLLSNPVAVSPGGFHTCALDDTGVVCWGSGTTNTGIGGEFGQSIVPALAFNNDTSNRHADPSGGNGYVLFELGPYDGTGADKAYDRSTRKGNIIPVNTLAAGENLVVAWYPGVSVGKWPSLAVSYAPEWPDATPIVIANQLGSGDLLSESFTGVLQRQNVRIYNQPDKAAPGYNPNEEHALIATDGNGDPVVYAMRDDLNGILNASKPYVLVKYQLRGAASNWRIDLLKVCATEGEGLCATGAPGTGVFAPTVGGQLDNYAFEAGAQIPLPLPMRNWQQCDENEFPDSRSAFLPANLFDPALAGWEDFQGKLWARAANDTIGDTIVHYHYPLQPGFFYDFDGTEGPDLELGTCVPWLDGGTDTPIHVAYEFTWPATTPVLNVGESLYTQKRELPALKGQLAAQIVYDQVTYADTNSGVDPIDSTTKSLVRLFDPKSDRKVALAALPVNTATFRRDGREYFSDLPFTLRSRLSFDEINQQLVFGGDIYESISGDPQVLPNIMTLAERDKIKSLVAGTGTPFGNAVEALYHKTRNPNQIDLVGDNAAEPSYLVGLMATQDADSNADGIPDRLTDSAPDLIDSQSLVRKPMILSAGKASGEGYITLAVNNHPDAANSPVDLYVIKVDGCTAYQGNIWIVPTDNVFEEALTLRHTGDFGGDPDTFNYEWYYQPDLGPVNAPANVAGAPPSPWLHHASGPGLVDITIEGPGVKTLSDNLFVTRYSGLTGRTCNGVPVPSTDVSNWAGAPGGTPASTLPQLATGWIKRVINGFNPFDSRVSDFHENEASTISSMISQLGEPYAGPVALNPDGDSINSIGLIEGYETVFQRGKKLSHDAGINDLAVNNQLLNVATRIGDFYHLLGNEAFADAADPTIGFDTGSQLGSLASSIFTFQNQLASPLDEELALLRGRDDSNGSVSAHPIYNRLLWNFTQGDGEVAYVQSYGITDQPGFDGFITEEDAHVLYPQGHGDGWGHYLTSVKMRYELLQEPNFNWIPRTESVLVAGNPIEVDYLDERKFAAAAAAKARTGAEIVNLTYRDRYVEDPNGQWQGYRDTDTDRAWGVDGWARRAGQGALFDWVAANAILPPEDLDPSHAAGIDKIDRTTVPELAQLVSQLAAIQAQVDRADAGLNPIGLAKGVVPFDIDPNFDDVVTGVQGKTHFEQIADRAQSALDNAVQIFDHVNQQSQALRTVQDDVDALAQSVVEQNLDFKHRLIEIYGYPYPNDPDTVPGFDGPDLHKYMYVSTNLTEDLPEPPDDSFISGFFSAINMGGDQFSLFFPEDYPDLQSALVPEGTVLEMHYPVSTGAEWRYVAPAVWGKRRAPGEIQIAISDVLQAQASLQLALQAHEHLIEEVEDALDVLDAEFFSLTENQRIVVENREITEFIGASILAAKSTQALFKFKAKSARKAGETVAEAIPEIAGFSFSIGAPAKGSSKAAAEAAATTLDFAANVAGKVALGLQKTKESVARQTAIDLVYPAHHVAIIERVKEVEQLWRHEPVLQLEMQTQAEVVDQAMGRYLQLLAEGDRLIEERRLFRITTAADTQAHRYRDMTFRIFRNDALQKYRAQFELAARYIYLAATAYDYETNLLGNSNGSGRDFLADIVRQRTVGQVINGVPIAGTPGLADVLARLTQNFTVYKGQLGFNNPQTETNRFSLRSELFRIRDDSDAAWRETLQSARVDNLWNVPEFRRFARAFAPEEEGPQPGLVLRFPTTVTFGLNYFGHPLGGGDSAYDPTNFATKVRSVGTWFSNYDGAGLSNTPRIYLFPVGMDVMRSPNDNTLSTREWRVVDQKLPVPFPIGALDLTNPGWIPANDSLSDTYADIRRFSSFRAYHDSGAFDPAETISDSRLIGRSVWNTEWMMIIPGGTLLFDGNEGLDKLISGAIIPGGLGERDGNGISDIKLFFQTYGYSGN